MIDDMNLTTVIKSKIFNEPYLSGFAVSVDFQGEVPSPVEWNRTLPRSEQRSLPKTLMGCAR